MLPETVVSSRWSAAPAELVRPPPDADLLLVTVTVSSVVVPEFVSAPPEALLAVPLVSVSWEKVAVEAAATLISCRCAADLGPSITVAPGPAPVTTTALAVTGSVPRLRMYVPAGTVMVVTDPAAAASDASIAPRRVHWPVGSAHWPLPGCAL